MKAYELLYMVAPTADEDTRGAIAARIEGAVSANGGVIDNAGDWGRHKLAYEIDSLTDADYILVDFHANPTDIEELDRVLRINDAVVRHMIVSRKDRD